MDLDIYKLSIKKNLPEKVSQIPRVYHVKSGEKFIKGPIPLEWMAAAGRLPGKVMQVATALWFQFGVEKSLTVSLSSKVLKKFGVDRHSKSRALKALERAGLVSVKQSPGCNPVVTFIEINPK
ncbi:MAG: hypothetical protein AB1649_34245 [Chloroflexota bacterium]